jgi:hypothetical protein
MYKKFKRDLREMETNLSLVEIQLSKETNAEKRDILTRERDRLNKELMVDKRAKLNYGI